MHTQQSFPGKKCGTGDHHVDHRMPGLQRPMLSHNGDLGGRKGDIKARGELLVIQNKEKGRGGKMNGDNGEVNMIQACSSHVWKCQGKPSLYAIDSLIN